MGGNQRAKPDPRRIRTVKLASEKKDEAIIGTNDYSIVSKRSVEKLYYPTEPQFLKAFVTKYKRRAPLVNRGYWLRMRAIERAVQDFLEEPHGQPKIVVNLGCGYDHLPFQSLFRYPDSKVRYVDVDYPQCIDKKVEIIRGEELYIKHVGTVYPVDPLPRNIANSGNFSSIHPGDSSAKSVKNGDLQDQSAKNKSSLPTTGGSFKTAVVEPKASSRSTRFSSERYVAIGCDLRQLAALKEALVREVDILNRAVLFVAEVSITYMDVEAADTVIRWAAGFSNCKCTSCAEKISIGLRRDILWTIP